MQVETEPVHVDQVEKLTRVIAKAAQISSQDREKLEAVNQTRHVRPTAGGFTLVNITHESPQLGWPFDNMKALLKQLDKKAKPTRKKAREKELQSALIRDAYANGRHLRALEKASEHTDEPVQLLFVGDELSLPRGEKKRVVCDLLALRVDGGFSRPVLLELKSSRNQKELLGQLEEYTKVMLAHEQLFAQFYGAVLGREIRFDGPPERWIVWPQAKGHEVDPREGDFRAEKAPVRLVSYAGEGPEYSFRVGNSVRRE